MSGHSHWATVRRKKELNDQQKGREFSRASREILLAISLGGNNTDPETNVRLRAAVEKAKEVNMPKENIRRLLQRAKEKREVVNEVVYEALLPRNVTALIKTVTDNPRRTQTDLKIILDKQGGKLVEKGAVMHGFDLLALFSLSSDQEDQVLKLIEALGAVDFKKQGSNYQIFVPREQFAQAWNRAKVLGYTKAPELVYRPKAPIQVEDATVTLTQQLVEKLDAVEEVQAVYLNFD